MKLILSILLILLTAFFSFAQRTRAITDPDFPIQEAIQLFQQKQYDRACPLFEAYHRTEAASPALNLSASQQEATYYAISCGLMQVEPLAENEAFLFLRSTPCQLWLDKMHFQLGDYYFRVQQWANCYAQYTQVGVANLSNEEIATLQFQQGYAAFVLKRYQDAKPLFNSVRALSSDPNQLSATYYYGLLAFRDNSWAEAMSCFQQVEKDTRYAAATPFYMAQIMLKQGDGEKVIPFLEQKLSNKVTPPLHALEMKQLLGHAYFARNNHTRALPLLREYVQQSKQASRQDIYEQSYSAYREANWKEAVEGFKQLSGVADSMGQHAMYLLGDAYLKLDDRAGARSAFLFCALNTHDPILRGNARFFHAKLSYELGFVDESLKELQEFLQAYPASPFITEARELLISVLAATRNYKGALLMLDSTPQPSEQVRKLIPILLYGRAVELIHDNKDQEALPLLDSALLDIHNRAIRPLLHFWKGELSFRMSNYEVAGENLLAYIALGAPASGEASELHARYNLGYAYLRMTQYKMAATYFEWVSGTETLSASTVKQDALLRLADCQYMLRNYIAASHSYEKLIQMGWTGSDYATFQLASIAGIRNPTEKISMLKTLERKYPGSSLVTTSWMEIADTYMAEEKYIEAIPYLDKIIGQNQAMSMLPTAYFKSGISYYNLGDNEKSLKYFQTLMDKFSHSAEAGEAMDNVKTIYLESGRTVEYIQYLKERGITLNANTEDSLHFVAAEQLFQDKQWNEARVSLQNYLEKFPTGAYWLEAHFMLADRAVAEKKWTKAIPHYEAILSRVPNRYAESSSLALANIYFFELNNYDSAAAKYSQVLQWNPHSEKRLESLRGTLRANYLLQKWETAVQAGELLLAEKKNSPEDKSLTALSTAKLLFLQGKETEAQFQCKQVMEQNKAALAAEARYEIAASLFRQKQWKAAERAAFETISRSGSYEHWVAKSYLLLGDLFFEQKDLFNAKATYRSVIENATQDVWKNEARSKLDLVNRAELSTGKIE